MTPLVPRARIAPLVAAAALLIAPQCLGAGPAPAGASSDCALLIAGTGTVEPIRNAPPEDVLRLKMRWGQLSLQLSSDLGGILGKHGYHLVPYAPDETAADSARLLENEIYRTGCSKLLRITYDLSGATSGTGDAPRSGFAVSVSRLEQTSATGAASRSVRIVEEYNVEYEYVPDRPKPTLAGLAQSVAIDLEKAGLLPR
jgi:hypothetical protein